MKKINLSASELTEITTSCLQHMGGPLTNTWTGKKGLKLPDQAFDVKQFALYFDIADPQANQHRDIEYLKAKKLLPSDDHLIATVDMLKELGLTDVNYYFKKHPNFLLSNTAVITFPIEGKEGLKNINLLQNYLNEKLYRPRNQPQDMQEEIEIALRDIVHDQLNSSLSPEASVQQKAELLVSMRESIPNILAQLAKEMKCASIYDAVARSGEKGKTR